jgi:hypothetical protein
VAISPFATAENAGAPAALPCNTVLTVPIDPRVAIGLPAPPPSTSAFEARRPEDDICTVELK